MANIQLAPVVKTDMRYGRTRTGQRTRFKECWAAHTPDGEWEFIRLDARGTSWEAYHLPSVQDGSLIFTVASCRSLDECRQLVGTGLAWELLAARKAEFNRKAS